MIFVTVGTHEQQFNRLIECVDKMVKDNIITEEVVIQIGFSTYEPKNCKWRKLFSYKDMQKYVNRARIVITHGGPSSFIAPLQVGKIPIVVPRRKEYGEHVNDHQVTFCKEVEKRNGNILVVENINELEKYILEYEVIVNGLMGSHKSNNVRFCKELERIVSEMI